MKTKYEIVYEERPGAGVTKAWVVSAEVTRERAGLAGGPVLKVERRNIGRVYWWAPWRRYIFHPSDAVFDETCLRGVADFLVWVSKEHRERRRKEKADAKQT